MLWRKPRGVNVDKVGRTLFYEHGFDDTITDEDIQKISTKEDPLYS
jgi:hypothetical protein